MNHRLALPLLGLGALLLPVSCGGGSGGGAAQAMVLEEVGNGSDLLLPHQTHKADAQGFPTATVVEIRSFKDLLDNVTPNNPILPEETWDTTAELPDGNPGSHFLYARFRQPIDPLSVLNPIPAAAPQSYLEGKILVTAIDPSTGTTTQIAGRAFIGGVTVGKQLGIDGTFPLEQWVTKGANGPVAVGDPDGDGVADLPGLGFPGTQQTALGQAAFGGANELLDPHVIVFVADADGNLLTHETFPTGRQIRMEILPGVRSVSGQELAQSALASSTVGPDTLSPEVKVNVVSGELDIDPPPGEQADPATSIRIRFTEPVQLTSVGDLPASTIPGLSSSVKITFGPTASLVEVPFTVMPESPFNLGTLILEPAYAFPAAGPAFAGCAEFGNVTISVAIDQIQDLVGRTNKLGPSSSFTTGEGPGLVNVPVTPDAIYVARQSDGPAISVIDLNGFGGGTGDPTFDVNCRWKEGNTNFPNNLNVALNGPVLTPKLSPGGCTFNGGSAGPFTLAKDSTLDDRVVRGSILDSISDMMLGHALDTTFNNGLPFGCQSNPGGNLCAQTALKVVNLTAGGVSTLAPGGPASPAAIKVETGKENLMTWAPHPNPPPLVFPPLCLSPNIGALEPTSIDTGVLNLLGPGALPLGSPETCVPPNGLLTVEQNAFFVGPSGPTDNPALCTPYAMRQQIGNFLYVADRIAGEVVVLNSNRMTVIDRITVPDPTQFAMSPDLDLLAITSSAANIVSFLDIDPGSSTFHQIVKKVPVGKNPTGVAWEGGNEDIFVCNTGSNSVTVISGFDLNPRKTLTAQLSGPFDVALTPRQLGFGLLRGVYFGYILNANGKISIFESGPDGVNGWGFDEIIGQPEFVFANPQAIQPDPINLQGAVWIAHEGKLDQSGNPTGLPGPAVSKMFLQSGVTGIIFLDPGVFVDPQLRDLEFEIQASVGSDQLTGQVVDIAFDNLRNFTALTNISSQFSPGSPLSVNGKSLVKPVTGGFNAVSNPIFMFCAVPASSQGPGVVDVIRLDTGFQRTDTNPFQPGIQSIPAPGVRLVMDYLRQ